MPPRRRPRVPGSRSTPAGEHVPILLDEILSVLAPLESAIVVDCTVGFGGHARRLLQQLGPRGQLFGFDLDGTYLETVQRRLAAVGTPFRLVQTNFAAIVPVLAEAGVPQVDAILADLGMSSMQVDDPQRGFSSRRDGPLDMRMDRSRGRTAAEVLRDLSRDELAQAFREWGDEPQAERIAQAIVQQRRVRPLRRTSELTQLILRAAPVQEVQNHPGALPFRRQKWLPVTRVFQALRILVNRELANLQALLRCLPQVLKPGGRVAILSFHSGEDRLVKAAFREGFHQGIYQRIAEEPIRPTEAEKLANPRSRSAKLRWAVRADATTTTTAAAIVPSPGTPGTESKASPFS